MAAPARVPVSGHWWTIIPNLLGRLRVDTHEDARFSCELPDPRPGLGGDARQQLVGWYGGSRSSDLFVLVHGLGGDASSPYMRATAAQLRAHGYATLRLSMRGAGESDPDFYHAGLATDLLTVLDHPSLARHRRVFVIGFSLGGHVSAHLSLLANPADARRATRVRAIVTVCAPLDLERNVIELDMPSGWIYRRHVLDGLTKVHRKVHAGSTRRFTTIREWDAETIVPRFGFTDCEEYWRTQSAGPRLRAAAIPILFIASAGDPMVPAQTLVPWLERAGSLVDVRWLRVGGHVGFPRDADLGMPGELGVIPQILSWVEKV